MAANVADTAGTTRRESRSWLGAALAIALILSACSTTTDGITPLVAPEPTSSAVSADDPSTADSSQDWAAELVPGSCFDEALDDEGEYVIGGTVDCAGPHQFEVYFASTFEAPATDSWPGFDPLLDLAFESFCDDELITFGGRPWNLLPFTNVAWVPDEAEWEAGSRSMVCTVTADEAGAVMIGSAAGSSVGPSSTDFIVSIVKGGHGGLELGIAGPDAGHANLTAQDIGLFDDAPAFDGARIVWFVADPDGSGARTLLGYQLATGDIIRIAAFDGRDVRNPTVAPDGTVIVSAGFAGSGEAELWAIETDGNPVQLTETPGVMVDHPVVTPDDRSVIFSASEGANSTLWSLDRSTGDLEQVTIGEANDTQPAVSPDGSQLVFTSDRSGDLDVWSVEVGAGPDTPPTNLSDHPSRDSQPAFSLATDRVFFQSNRFGYEDTTMFMSRDGSEQASVTFEGVRSPVVLDPDLGRWIYRAVFNNQLRFCPVAGGDGVTDCDPIDGFELVSVTVHPEPVGAPWPGFDEITERTITRDCKAALDELFGDDRDQLEVTPIEIEEELWDYGTRTSACMLNPDQ